MHSISPKGGDGTVSVNNLLSPDGILGFLKRIIGTNFVPYPLKLREYIKPGSLILNVGSGMISDNHSTVNLDYFLFPSVDIVADAHNIPFEDGSFDVIQTEFMIEHVKDPFQVASEVSRVLKPGGILYISYPFIHPYHSFPDDYFRFTNNGIRSMFPDMDIIVEGPLTGPACRWVGATADLISFFMPGQKLRLAARGITLALLCPVKLFDMIFNKMAESKNHAVTLFSLLCKRKQGAV